MSETYLNRSWHLTDDGERTGDNSARLIEMLVNTSLSYALRLEVALLVAIDATIAAHISTSLESQKQGLAPGQG